MSTILKQYPSSFGEIIGNGKTLEVPPFQRDYSWGEEEWDDLWQDILNLDSQKDHYMGYIVLQGTETDKRFTIIDGQQRIATLSILILGIVKLLKDRGDEIRAEQVRELYLSKTDIITQTAIPKLKLNYNNEVMYGGKLLQLTIPDKFLGLKSSEIKLVNAFNYFYQQLIKLFKTEPTENLLQFLEKKLDIRLFFTVIVVEEESDAYTIFETLNARGVRLSSTDLFRNYLFSRIFSRGAGNISHEERKWHRINDLLGNLDINTFLWHIWTTQFEVCSRKTNLFKSIKNKLQTPPDGLKLLNQLHESAPIYSALANAQSNFWNSEIQTLIEELNILEAKTTFGLLVNAWQKWSEQDFKKLLKEIIALYFRYSTIGGLNPNEWEIACNKAAFALYQEKVNSPKELITQYFKDIYIGDDSFKNDFQNKIINTRRYNRLVKYILSKIEEQLSRSKPDIYARGISVEHILPENPDEHWHEYFEDPDAYIYRLGNLTLLESSKNKDADRLPFSEKIKIYESSHYTLSSKGLDYEFWNPSRIAIRQREMANIAAGVWRKGG